MEEEDDPSISAAAHLQTLISSLSSSTARLSNRSRAVPSDKDFHFFNNFPEFKLPVKQIQSLSESSLQTLASSKNLFGGGGGPENPPPLPADLDESYDWLVSLNDDLIERFNVSMDEFKSTREKQEGKVTNLSILEEGGFQLVRGKNRGRKKESNGLGGDQGSAAAAAGVRIGMKEKAVGARSKVPFHIPTIPRPQDQFSIIVNNLNMPFEHVWLERSEDGSRVVHPLEKLSVANFVDRSIKESEEMVKPLPLESTPFKLVEVVKELKVLAAKLRDASEFAVDLEHNQYRSFQGLTCLMQISTRSEDFIIDTLKLRVHIGPYLREVFKDPSKRKVMHGADRDIEWLQRDFGIYVCNLFDTGQASRVLQLERNSLEYLLHHFCGVSADKEYQNADWRLRPLPAEMLKYAREDTHYLLYIYNLMRQRLLSASTDGNDLLLEVYKRSCDICTHLYQKELLTETSYLYIYGLQEADFNSKQLAIVAGLHEWRDRVARDEDESTGYILPNRALLEIARQMPVSPSMLRRLVKSRHSFVESNLNTVISIIRSSIENSSAFETIAEELKQARTRQSMEEAVGNTDVMPATENSMDSTTSRADLSDVITSNVKPGNSVASTDGYVKPANTKITSDQIVASSRCQQYDKPQSMLSSEIVYPPGMSGAAGTTEKEKVSTVSVQISKKPSFGFGALLGNSASRRKLNPDKEGVSDQNMNVNKVEQIKSSVTLPFFSFTCRDSTSGPNLVDKIKHSQPETPQQWSDQPSETKLEDLILLENDETDSPQSPPESPMVNDDATGMKCFPALPENGEICSRQPELETGEEHNSLSDLSSSFQQCFQTLSEMKSGSRKNQRQYQEPEPKIQVKPFDYAAARKNAKYGGTEEHVDGGVKEKTSESRDKSRGKVMARDGGEDKAKSLRRQAFPPSGNRSTTYK
ncbi:protein RRP6-like 2 [Iris pallida]|uniref:Protein RRP6-like 2 n=1 Tax=Iris pallida TaxID=29817 RepID=A0AAX6F331_IRIPA|nr:protein RRP6-like 2 [Iris pallida]